MNSLQQLLDEKFPITKETTEEVIFISPTGATHDRNLLLDQCRKMIKDGLKLSAVKLYKETTGCSLLQALDALGIQQSNNDVLSYGKQY